MVGSVLRMVSITPLQVPGVCQQHSDVFVAAAVGFGTGHHKLDTGYESLSGSECRGKGLTPGSAIAQAEKISHRVLRRQNPPQLPMAARGNSFHTEPQGMWLVARPRQGAGGGKQGWQKQRAALSKIHPE